MHQLGIDLGEDEFRDVLLALHSDGYARIKNSTEDGSSTLHIFCDQDLENTENPRNMLWIRLRDSDYADLISLCTKVFGPSRLELSSWPTCIRNDYISAYQKYVAFLTDYWSKQDGKSVLFIPDESEIEQAETVQDETIFVRLEGKYYFKFLLLIHNCQKF